jgi:hypothetical protein
MCIYCFYDFDKCCNKICGKVACCKCGYICGSKNDDEIMDYEFHDDIGRDVTDKVISIFKNHVCKAIDNYDEKCNVIVLAENLRDEYTSEILLCLECFNNNKKQQ